MSKIESLARTRAWSKIAICGCFISLEGVKHVLIVQKDSLYLHLEALQKDLFSSCCVTTFFRRCLTNPTFLVFQWLILTLKTITVRQTSPITPNSNTKSLTTSQDLKGNLGLKLLCDAIFPSFPGQSTIPCLTT